MSSYAIIVNRALQKFGTRTDVTAAELVANNTNEAKAANLILENSRDDLLRMAPWDCGLRVMNMDYITSIPGTPENMMPATNLWQRGQPMPPWAYEYQYPVDCLKACWVIPAFQTGFSGGIPITTAVTGGAPAFWNGPPVKFKVATDTFYPITATAVAVGGSGYAIGDEIVLARGPNTAQPIGAPVKLRVLTVLAGVILTVEVVNQIYGQASNEPLGGSYFFKQTNPQAQDKVYRDSVEITTATGATFNLTYGELGSQRVILTNQEFATLAYVHRVINPNVMDTLFQSAWISILGAGMCMGLTGDKSLANMMIEDANRAIAEARKADANEGLVVNDITPDWIRGRGYAAPDQYSSPYSQFDWGAFWPLY